MDLAVLGRIANASLKTYDTSTPSEVEIINIFGDNTSISVTTKAEGKTVSISLRKTEEKSND